MCPLINTPPPTEGVIISQPIFRFLGVIFDEVHDFEGLRSPRAHLDTVLRNLSRHLGTPRKRGTALSPSLNGAHRVFYTSAAISQTITYEGTRNVACAMSASECKTRAPQDMIMMSLFCYLKENWGDTHTTTLVTSTRSPSRILAKKVGRFLMRTLQIMHSIARGLD